MSASSTIELTLMRDAAPRPASACWRSISASICSISPERTVRGATSSRLNRLRGAIAGQLVEQAGEVLADLRVGGEQAEVLVEAGGLGVVVAGADVAVAAQPLGLLADDEATAWRGS